jgi:hypothetical protein
MTQNVEHCDVFSGCFPLVVEANGKTTAFSEGRPVVALRDHPANWLSVTIKKIDALSSLERNWDSYGADPVDNGSIERARELVEYLACVRNIDAPTVTATPEGNVALCWDEGNWSLDASVDSSGLVAYVFLDEQDSANDRDTWTRDIEVLAALLTRW